jgi:enoyl-CoA hydratase/carnithine racemase
MIGTGRAYEIMLTGDFITAQEALSLGLVSRIVEREDLYETAMGFARKMMTKNLMGLRLTKEAINVNIDCGGLENALQVEDRNQTLLSAGLFFTRK